MIVRQIHFFLVESNQLIITSLINACYHCNQNVNTGQLSIQTTLKCHKLVRNLFSTITTQVNPTYSNTWMASHTFQSVPTTTTTTTTSWVHIPAFSNIIITSSSRQTSRPLSRQFRRQRLPRLCPPATSRPLCQPATSCHFTGKAEKHIFFIIMVYFDDV